jgi:hypothetical protein
MLAGVMATQREMGECGEIAGVQMFSGSLMDVPEGLALRLVEWAGSWMLGRIDGFYMAGGEMSSDVLKCGIGIVTLQKRTRDGWGVWGYLYCCGVEEEGGAGSGF